MKRNRKIWKRVGWVVGILFIIGNIIIYNHAYRFTHFVNEEVEKTKKPEELSFSEKFKVLFSGISVPKPINTRFPTRPFESFRINSLEKLEAWKIEMPQARGIVIMFHGYSSAKSGLLPYSQEFNEKGYSTVLVDFMGSGGSTGYTTTIGFKESSDVRAAFNAIKSQYPNEEIILFGCSMGAVAILKAVDEYDLKPDKIILECPFGSMLTTTKKRFEAMHVPQFPFAHLLLFYGGLQTGFNPFKHNPTEYAKGVDINTLLLYGAKDQRVSRAEIDQIFDNLAGEKRLIVFEKSAHEIYLNDHYEDWNTVVDEFLMQ